tara:strand:+ start:1403 stop:1768 length:366 start_codon:yes stop_codon:yes gene_type:complete
MAENWKEILKAAMPIGQMQRDTESNLGNIVNKLIQETKYTDRLNKKLGKAVRANPDQTSYTIPSPIFNRISQKFRFRGQPQKIKTMLEQKLAQEYQAEKVVILDKEIRFEGIKQPPEEETS